MKPLPFFHVFPLAVFALAAHSHAALLLSEDFSSYGDVSISGQAATSPNSTGNWDATTDSFGNFTVSTGRLNFSRTSDTVANRPKYAGFSIASTTATNTTSSEFWATGTLSTGSLQGAFFSTAIFATDGPHGAPFVNKLIFGIDGGKAFLARDYDFFDNFAGSITLHKLGESTTTFDSTAHTLLIQFINVDTSNDAFRLWVDPDTSGGAGGLGAPDVEISTGNMIFNSGDMLYWDASPQQTRFVGITSAATGMTQTGWLDDYRLGTAFVDVVPEPSAALLSLAGVMTMLCIRRRASCRERVEDR